MAKNQRHRHVPVVMIDWRAEVCRTLGLDNQEADSDILESLEEKLSTAVTSDFQAENPLNDGQRTLYSRRGAATTLPPLTAHEVPGTPQSPTSITPTKVKGTISTFRMRPCYVMCAFMFLVVTCSAILAIYYTVSFDKMGDGFTAAGWIVAVGTLVLAGPIARHYPHCICWNRGKPYSQDHHRVDILLDTIEP